MSELASKKKAIDIRFPITDTKANQVMVHVRCAAVLLPMLNPVKPLMIASSMKVVKILK